MTIQKIRKNATKKIQAYLDQAVGIISESASMQIDDSFDYSQSTATPSEVLAWLARPSNYRTAKILLIDGEVLKIGGPYHFSDEFHVYLDQDLFNKVIGADKEVVTVEDVKQPLPSNVISLCEYRQRMAG